VERDKLLFKDMGLPVSKQWLYDRHKVPAPGPSEDLFLPRGDGARQRADGPRASVGPEGVTEAGALRALKEQSTNETCCIEAASESTESLNARKAQAATDLAELLRTTDLSTHDLVWTAGDCPVCSPLNGTTYPDGWTTPPPIHHNCDCEINVQSKTNKT
jgi:hypothetical protein